MGLLSSLALGLAVALTAQPMPASAIELPEPGGTGPLGTHTLHLVDLGREDPFAPGEPRDIVVQLWYPATDVDGHRLAPCLEPILAEVTGLTVACQTHSYESAPIDSDDRRLFGLVRQQRRYPVVLYSPAYGSSRNLGTALIEELASRGYIVAAIDHPYDAIMLQFPGGRAAPMQPDESDPPTDLTSFDAANKPYLAVRVADTRYVLDALQQIQEGQNPSAEANTLPRGLSGAFDLSRVGMLGHSLGGATTAEAMLEDPRIRAGFVMDGVIPDTVRASGLNQPLLLMASPQPDPGSIVENAWSHFHSTGWQRGMRLAGSGHNSFTDLSIFCSQLGSDCDPYTRASLGTINGDRAVQVQRAYVSAFFHQFLQGGRASILDKPSSGYGEVSFI